MERFNSSIDSFSILRKYGKQHIIDKKKKKLAILGNSSTQHLSEAVYGLCTKNGLAIDIFDAGYNQLDALILEMHSELYQYEPDYVFIYITPENLYEKFISYEYNMRENFAEIILQQIQQYWEFLSAKNYTILQSLIALMDEGIFGAYSACYKYSYTYQLRKLNYLLAEAIMDRPQVFCVDTLKIGEKYGWMNIHDNKLYHLAKMSCAYDYIPYIAKCITDVMISLEGKMKKCIVFDLDNTIWGGVIGEDGLDGIEIGDYGQGKIYSEIQLWLKELSQRGILLAVCSKNDENIAKEAFLKHPDMILKLEDIVLFVANWENKAANIKYIQECLNIAMDSIVFIDDNPFEREQVRREIKELEIPELPDNPLYYLDFLKECNYFETTFVTEEDADRTRQYKAEAKRQEYKKHTNSYNDYLLDLHMKIREINGTAFYAPRISQLTQRTNQFNLRTIRYTQSDIIQMLENPNYEIKLFDLKDKFGEYGVISVVILKREKPDTIFLDTWLMSCRVFKRGVENYVMNHIIEFVKKENIRYIYGEYIPTAKNHIVENLFYDLGYKRQEDGVWLMDVNNYKKAETMIEEMDDV